MLGRCLEGRGLCDVVNDRHNTMLSEAKREKDILEAVIRVLSRLVVPKRIAENPGTQRIIINAPVFLFIETNHQRKCIPFRVCLREARQTVQAPYIVHMRRCLTPQDLSV